MVRQNILLKKISIIRDHINRIESQKNVSKIEFLENRDIQDIVCFNLLQAIQGLVDIGNHIISDEAWAIPGSSAEVIQILNEKKIITSDQKDTFVQMIGFRNKIAHEYFDTDFEEVYTITTNNLNDIHSFIDSIVEFYNL